MGLGRDMTTRATGAGLIGSEFAPCAMTRASAQALPAPLDSARAKHFLGWKPSSSIAAAFADYPAELKQATAIG